MLRIALAAFACFFLAGCTTHPPRPSATADANAINFAVLTELYCAASELRGVDNKPFLASDNNWVALVDLNLSASVEGSVNPIVSLLGPLNLAKAIPVGGSTGTFASVFSGSFDQTRTNLREYKIYIYLKTLVKGDPTKKVPSWDVFAKANNWPVNCDDPNGGGTYLQGRLGFKEWLAPAITTDEATQQYAPLNPPAAPPAPVAPTISDIFPKEGRAGTPVSITGANFDTATVIFGKASPIKIVHPKSDPTKPDTSGTLITVNAPAQPDLPEGGAVDVVVRTQAGMTASTKFTYLPPPIVANAAAPAATTGGGGTGAASGSSQSPTISATFTFTIKATGTIGPSFILSRVSGGATNLFTVTRTDNSFVNLILTPATYCPTTLGASPITPPTCMQTVNGPPNSTDMQNTITRIENSLLNLNFNHAISP
jgi:hypothetical protein